MTENVSGCFFPNKLYLCLDKTYHHYVTTRRIYIFLHVWNNSVIIIQ